MKVGIAGAGIMGRLLAFYVMKAGHHISLFDQDKRAGKKSCSWAAAGLLQPTLELQKSNLIIYQLGKVAIEEHWPALLHQLSESIYFQHKGSLMVAHSLDQAELLHRVQTIQSKLEDEKLIPYHYLNTNDLLKLEPELDQFSNAYFFPDEAQIDSQAVFHLLEKELSPHIRWYHNHHIQSVDQAKIVTEKGTHRFDLVLDCRGLGASSFFSDLHGVRGELIGLYAPHVKINRPVRLVHPRYALYVVPRPQHRYLIGASEIMTHDESAISVRSTLELLTAAYSMHPGFAEARILQTVTQCRPTLFDHLPKIKYAEGFIAMNGLYRHGYLIAPSLAKEVMRWIEGGMNALHYSFLWEAFI
jgi:glycine oxidase